MREDMRNILEVNFRVSLLPGGGDQHYLVSRIKLVEEGGGRCWSWRVRYCEANKHHCTMG